MDRAPLVIGAFAFWALSVWICGGHGLFTGEFGDAFGPVTGFVTALALLLAISGNAQQAKMLRLQQEELRLTREEMKDTREVLDLQRRAQEEQAKLQDRANRLQDEANRLERMNQLNQLLLGRVQIEAGHDEGALTYRDVALNKLEQEITLRERRCAAEK